MPDKNGWIRVEDALPEMPSWQWVWPVGKQGHDGYYSRWDGVWRNKLGNEIEVTHYQPQQYPEPPEDE
ncbi:hypothetical protein LCGC14_2781010 [marine sediment metagenome]|uniref:Uncharacterized protein n=1 Tax=marine sediment metagenome TaxID=412755 RepID=A0A0F8ZFE8_9ZZZZ